MEHTCGNVSQAARLMGLSRAQMMYRVDKLKQ
ncbi:helix-turn-helix domain-containing protein [Pseudomonas sp.]